MLPLLWTRKPPGPAGTEASDNWIFHSDSCTWISAGDGAMLDVASVTRWNDSATNDTGISPLTGSSGCGVRPPDMTRGAMGLFPALSCYLPRWVAAISASAIPAERIPQDSGGEPIARATADQWADRRI